MTTWVKVFNSMPSHPKFLSASCNGGWLFVCGLCYANEHLTDGFIPVHALPALAPGMRTPQLVAARLVLVGLWHKVEGGWQIHDYHEHQRSSDDVRERREKDRQRKSVRRDSNGSPHGNAAESARIPRAQSETVRDLDVEVEKRREDTSSLRSEVTRKRATRRVDQSQLPDDFPDDLLSVVDSVQPILIRCWDARGGIEPGRRGVGLAVLRNPRADHEQVARKLEHWLLAGKGQRARCGDVASRFGDWVEDEGAALRLVDGGAGRQSAGELIAKLRAAEEAS